MLVSVVLLLFAESIEGNSSTQSCFNDYGTPVLSTPIFSPISSTYSPWSPTCKGFSVSYAMTGVFSQPVDVSYVEATLINYDLTIWNDNFPIQPKSYKPNQLYTLRFPITIPNFDHFCFGDFELNLKLLDPNGNELNCWASYFTIQYGA